MAKRKFHYPADPKILEIARAIARQAARDDYEAAVTQWQEAQKANQAKNLTILSLRERY